VAELEFHAFEWLLETPAAVLYFIFFYD